MKEKNIFKRTIKFIIIITIFFLIAKTNGKSRVVSGFEIFIGNIITFPEKGFKYLEHYLKNQNDYFDEIDELKQKNRELQNKIDLLNAEMVDYDLIVQNYNSIKESTKIEETYDYDIAIANVISDSANNWDSLYIIDKGLKDGIKPNQIVITKDGLVGYIYTCFESTSKVISILDAGNTISARCIDSRDAVIVKGNLKSKEKQELIINNIPYGVTFESGDEFETSGMGGVYPKGIKIGKVTKIVNKKNPLENEFYIKTFVDFNKIEKVAIIIDNIELNSGDKIK